MVERSWTAPIDDPDFWNPELRAPICFYFVNIDSVVELEFDAAAKQVSQFEPAVNRYRPDWTAEDLKRAKDEMHKEQPKKDGYYVEAFRYSTGFVQY